jgi:hypothetical protein
MSFFSFSLSDWSSCEQVWKECAKTNTACGCIAYPTIWTILSAIGIILGTIWIKQMNHNILIVLIQEKQDNETRI